ncbi:sugar transferase [Flexivirga alba]|uniref:Sugar transferase n=1 Tax=Flexivirga alba TaxID=702742 RepID=A0ABW2AGQ5_9MICO
MREFARFLQHDDRADRSGDLRGAEVPPLTSKRCFDIAAASIGLLITAPVSVVAGIATRMSSPGPALFVQTRIGLDGREIKVHKFRTMRVGSPGPMITEGRDPRITSTGAILRRTKVDELPQLWDVLLGSMSIVGPRPEVREYVDQWPPPCAR